MKSLVAWIQQLGFLVFFAGLVQILLPDNDLRKVARLVIGLVLILAVVEPVIGWLDGASFWDALDVDGAFARWLPSGEAYVRRGEELAAEAVAHVHGEWLAQAEREVAALVALVPGVGAADVSLQMGSGGVDSVSLRLTRLSLGGNDPVDEEQIEARASRIVEAFLPGIGPERIQVIWVGRSVEGR